MLKISAFKLSYISQDIISPHAPLAMKKELHFMQSKFFNQANGFPENTFPLIWQMIKWADWQLPSLSLSHKSHVSSSVEKSTLFFPTMCIIIVCHNCYICIFTGFVPALVMDYRLYEQLVPLNGKFILIHIRSLASKFSGAQMNNMFQSDIDMHPHQ